MLKKVIVFLFFLTIGVVYIHNLTRDIYSGDIGDLVTAAYTLGVAHPPGYPLFSLLGFIFSHLPFPLPVVSRVGLISVLSSIAGLIIYYKFVIKVSKSLFISLLSTSILAFSYLFWLTAELPEGLALNNFFVIITLYLAFLFQDKKKTKYLYLLSLLLGLSLTHQLHIVTLFPAILILISKHLKFIFSRKRSVIALLFFLLGLALYVYVPIAASRNPPINWDSASSLQNFIHLVLRKDYGGVTKSAEVPIQIRLINAGNYFKTVINVFSYQVIFLAILGIIYLFKINKRFLLSLLIGFFFTGVISVVYVVNPVSSASAWGIFERYYVLSMVVLMFVIPYGFLFLKNFLQPKFSKPIFTYLLLSYFLIIPVLMIKYNFVKTDLSKTSIGNSLANSVLMSLPRNAVLFVSGDNTTFNTWYLYYVLKKRQDIDIINPPGVGNNIFLDEELNKYYSKNPKIDKKEIISKTFEVIRNRRRMFATYQIDPMPKGTVLLPQGLIYEIVNNNKIPVKEDFLKAFEKKWKKVSVKRREKLTLAEQNFIAPEIPFIYSMGMVRVGDFLLSQYHDAATAEHYYRRALWIDDTNPQAYSGLAVSLFRAYNDCNNSLQNIRRAIEIYPIWKKYYAQEYFFAKKCRLNSADLQKMRNEYKKLFRFDIEKDLL